MHVVSADREERVIVLSLPYDAGWSKNATHQRTKSGRTYIAAKAKALREALIAIISLQHIPWASKQKLFVNIFVTRPNLRMDPANFIDWLLDSIQRGTGVNDRYYSVLVDWELDRDGKGGIELVLRQPEGGHSGFSLR